MHFSAFTGNIDEDSLDVDRFLTGFRTRSNY